MNAMPASTDLGLPNDLGRILLSSLSWSREEGERLRLMVITAVALLLFVPLALVIPALDIPAPEREKAESLPPQLARLLVKPVANETPALKPKPKPVPQVAKPEVSRVPVKQSPKPTSQSVEQARETASRAGLLTMKDRLASMRQPSAKAAPIIQANAGNMSASGNGIKAETQRAEDTLKGSGGVKGAQGARADVEVAGHQVRKIDVAPQAASALAGAPVPTQRHLIGERAMSNIRQGFDSGKTALYSLYQRELRQDPTLAGKVLLELVIEPDGSVSACKVVSSELESPALEQKIAMRVRLFNFGADKVETRKVRFPIDFLPG